MENNSGIQPQEYNVVVEPRTVEEKTKGGVILSQDIVGKDQNAQTKGVLVAISPMAFKNVDWPKDQEDKKPKVGDMVAYARYSGASSRITGKDGAEYIILKDIDITAVIED